MYDRNGEYSLFISKCMKFGVYVDYDYACKLYRGTLFGSSIQLKNFDSPKF
jgi:hypothetical protein